MKRFLIIVLLLAAAPGFAQMENPPVALDEYPLTDGSTSARPIGRVVFLEMFGIPWERTPQPAPSVYQAPPEDEIEPTDPETIPADIRAGYERIAEHSGTHEAYDRLTNYRIVEDAPSLIFECRLPSPDERWEQVRREAEFDFDCAPIARDAFIFIVREDCPVEGLTLDQVRGIFSGRITNWQEVGGPDVPILAITRNRNSGSQETMRHLVMCGRDTAPMSEDTSAHLEPAQDMFGPFGMLNRHYGQGIAYTFYSYWEHMARRRGTKALAINGVAPTAETIASGEYPLCTSVYAVIRSTEEPDSPARRLREWLLTDEGQAVIERTGYVSLRQAWPPPQNAPQFAADEWPRIDGSTSAQFLMEVVRSEVMQRPWSVFVFDRYGIGGPQANYLLAREDPTIESWSARWWQNRPAGTHGAWEKLIRNEADLIFECRLPSEDERALMNERGVEVDARPVAKDAFVFIMNAEAPIDNLTLQQIRDIYTGEITRWSEVGLQGEAPEHDRWQDTIEAWSRERNSGSQETMISLVMGGLEMVESPGDRIAYEMSGPFDVLHTVRNAICFTFWSYHHLMLPDRGVKMLAVEGVYPTPDTIADGSYPLVTDTYAVVRASSPDTSPEVRLRDWLLTEEGQQVVARSCYVPLGDGG